MDAWEVLEEKSTLTIGDAWERFNALGGGKDRIIFVEGLKTANVNAITSASVTSIHSTSGILEALSAVLRNENLSANINSLSQEV